MAEYDKWGRRTIPISTPRAIVECIDKECKRRKRSRNFILNEWIEEKCRTLFPEDFPEEPEEPEAEPVEE